MTNRPPELFKRDRTDYHIIMGAICLILGIGLLSAVFPVLETILTFITVVCLVGSALTIMCIGIGKYLKYRRLEHEAYYGDPSTFPEAKERNDGQV